MNENELEELIEKVVSIVAEFYTDPDPAKALKFMDKISDVLYEGEKL